MKSSLKFSVIGENDDIHRVEITREPGNKVNLAVTCTCGEAQQGHFCNHRFEILEGDVSNLTSDNIDDIDELKAWVKGSDIEVAMVELAKAKSDLRMAREKVAYRRKILVQRMMD